MSGFLRLIGGLGLLVIALWIGGCLRFVDNVQALAEPRVAPDLEKTDAIVVLTGGSERVTTGLQLLESGIGKKLFISGVHKGLTLDTLLGAQPVSDELRECCITLGHQAASTVGNAEETVPWLQEEDFRSLRLVTANYHMPRSMLLFRAAMPDIKIIPHPVAPDSVKLFDWWKHPKTIDLLATEYSKYLYVDLRISFDDFLASHNLSLPAHR